MQLRYNVSQIEEFLSRRNLRDKQIVDALAPLVQASQLMQVKKQDEKDATQLLSMCSALTGAQVTLFLHNHIGYISVILYDIAAILMYKIAILLNIFV